MIIMSEAPSLMWALFVRVHVTMCVCVVCSAATRPQTADSTACLCPGCPPLRPARHQTWRSGPACGPSSRPLLHRRHRHMLQKQCSRPARTATMPPGEGHLFFVFKQDATTPTCTTLDSALLMSSITSFIIRWTIGLWFNKMQLDLLQTINTIFTFTKTQVLTF